MYIEEPVHGSTRRGENLNLWLLVECLQIKSLATHLNQDFFSCFFFFLMD
jgi:hypothetical protein